MMKTKLICIRLAAKRGPLFNLTHHVQDVSMLKLSAAKSGMTPSDDELAAISAEIKSGGYRTARFLDLVKSINGKERQLAVPPPRDMIVQRLCRLILDEALENQLTACSYERRGKGTHKALSEIKSGLRASDYVWRVDIEKFYNNVPHELLFQLLEQQIKDKHFIRIIKDLLRAERRDQIRGVGLPTGSPVSPVLGDLFLSKTIDACIANSCGPEKALYVRYRDDLLLAAPMSLANELKHQVENKVNEIGLTLSKDPKRNSFGPAADPVNFLGHELQWNGGTPIWVIPPGSQLKILSQIEIKLANCPEALRRELSKQIFSGYQGSCKADEGVIIEQIYERLIEYLEEDTGANQPRADCS